MAQIRPTKTSSPPTDRGRGIKDDHERILALFHQYLGSPPDSRQALVEEILQRLALHLERVESVFQEIRKSGPQGQELVGDVELKHEKIKAMISELQQSETDDDEAVDEFFVDMMQSVRGLFMIEERNLLPIVDRSVNS